jgi:hypothetical protein
MIEAASASSRRTAGGRGFEAYAADDRSLGVFPSRAKPLSRSPRRARGSPRPRRQTRPMRKGPEFTKGGTSCEKTSTRPVGHCPTAVLSELVQALETDPTPQLEKIDTAKGAIRSLESALKAR